MILRAMIHNIAADQTLRQIEETWHGIEWYDSSRHLNQRIFTKKMQVEPELTLANGVAAFQNRCNKKYRALMPA